MADSADPPNLQIIETAITDLNSGKVLQSNRWWLELIEGDDLYRVDISGQAAPRCARRFLRVRAQASRK